MADFFEREKVPFALAGAFALHAYGFSRATSDVEFVTDSGMLDLDRDLPTTAEDVAALRSAKSIQPLDSYACLRFLASLPPCPTRSLRERPGHRGDRPFSLVD
jgi:hypothetical protein